jgi:hypothetical protein
MTLEKVEKGVARNANDVAKMGDELSKQERKLGDLSVDFKNAQVRCQTKTAIWDRTKIYFSPAGRGRTSDRDGGNDR